MHIGKEAGCTESQNPEYFPDFDQKAVDTAHFIFGVENPTVEYYDGNLTIDEFMENLHKLPEVILWENATARCRSMRQRF